MKRAKNHQAEIGCINQGKFLVFLLAISHRPLICNSASCCSVCDCKGLELWCEERGLTSVPTNIPRNIQRIYMFSNNISSIPEEAFAQLQNLELIDLRSNQLTSASIEGNIFGDLPHLQDLLLSDNKIKVINKITFFGIPNLVRLYLEDNDLEIIEDGAFANLHSLLELKLGRNSLSNFPKVSNRSSNLRRLCLSNNNLVRLESDVLKGVNLEQLSLSNNHLHQLPSTIFSDVSNMRELDLSGNRISRLPRIISQMSSLRSLNLSGNPIAALPHHFLSNLQRMKVLDLSGLQLTTLSEGFIPRRVYLNIFDISSNPWKCDCSLKWILHYMRAVSGVFVRMSHVQCDAPLHLHGRRFVSLHENDFNCIRNTSTVNFDTELILDKQPNVSFTCEITLCRNGGTCIVDRTTGKPRCRCPIGRTGRFCDRVISTTIDLDPARLFVPNEQVTADSLQIVFPRTIDKVTISVKEIAKEVDGWSFSESFFPTSNIYTIEKLKPSTTYKICLHIYDVSEGDLCETVRTKASKDGSYSNISLPSVVSERGNKTTYKNPEIANNEKLHNEAVDKKSLSQHESNDLLYPVLGACVAFCLIIATGILIFVCRRKNFSTGAETESLSESKIEEFRPFTTQESLSTMEQECCYKKGKVVYSSNDLLTGLQRSNNRSKCSNAFSIQKTTNCMCSESIDKCKTLNEKDVKYLQLAQHKQSKCFNDSYDTFPKKRTYYHCSGTPSPSVHSKQDRLCYSYHSPAANIERQGCIYPYQHQQNHSTEILTCRETSVSPVYSITNFPVVQFPNQQLVSGINTSEDIFASSHQKVPYSPTVPIQQISENIDKNSFYYCPRETDNNLGRYSVRQSARDSPKIIIPSNQTMQISQNTMII